MPPVFLALLAMLPCIYCSHYFIHLLVPIRRPHLYSLLSVLASSLIWSINHILSPQICVAFDLLIYLADLVLVFLLVPRKKQPMFLLIYVLLTIVQMIVASLVLSGFTAALQLPPSQVIDPASMNYPSACLVTTAASIAAMYLFILLLRKLLPPLRENRIVIAFTILFFCQILFIYIIGNLYVYGKTIPGASLTLAIASFIYLSASIVFLRGYQSMHRMDLEALKFSQVQQQLELQISYYQQLQNNIIQVNQIRHDLSNQLQAAYYLLEKGEHEQVRHQLDALDHQIRDKVGTKFCANMIVDAILTEKARQCREFGIPLCLSVFLPEELPVETAHLCSVFSNILDNSIQATLNTEKPYKTIELSADVHGSLITIASSNPCRSFRRSEQHDLLRTHGLGLEILESLARRYHGSMHTSMENGRFQLNIVLKLAEAPGSSGHSPSA